MRRILGTAVLLLALGGFGVISQAIIRVTMLELRTSIVRDQLLNYELSSRMLRVKFRQMRQSKDDVSSEMKLKVLESSVMNAAAAEREVHLSVLEKVGVITINAIRRITLKAPISLEEERGQLVLLQYAFLQERNRNYEGASRAYSDLIEMQKGRKSDNNAFALLHHGYSKAMIGRLDDARTLLTGVISSYPATHYAENAYLLLSLLEDAGEVEKRIQGEFANDRDRARAYYTTGQFALAARTFDKVERLNTEETYMHGRSLEETGQTERALARYSEVMQKTDGTELRKQANRRLLMIGNFYGGGEQIAKAAEKKAEELGDKEVVAEVKSNVVLAEKPVVVEELKQAKEADERLAGLERIRQEMEETVKKQEEVVARTVAVVEKPPEVVKPPVVKPTAMVVELVDGRRLRAEGVIHDGANIHLKRGGFSVSIPFTMLRSVTAEEKEGVNYTERGLVIILEGKDPTRGASFQRSNARASISTKEGDSFIKNEELLEIRLP